MELPDELKKLEINSIPLPIKLSDDNIPVNLNPFFYQVKFETSNLSNDDKTSFSSSTKLFGPKCNCMYNLTSRRNHRFKETHSDDSIERQIINQTKLKTKLTGTKRKIILKDPILKCVQNCYSHVRHKHCIGNGNKTNDLLVNHDNSSVLLSDCSNLDYLKLDNELICRTGSTKMKGNRDGNIIKFNSGTNEFLDFRNLITECELISSNCNLIDDNNVSLINKTKLQNFTTIQNRTNSTLYLKSDDCRDDIDDDDDTNKLSINVQNNSNNASSTSCSQQARINPTTSNCDVTIDELASYFETFVHIPKKMSSMAEMMYI